MNRLEMVLKLMIIHGDKTLTTYNSTVCEITGTIHKPIRLACFIPIPLRYVKKKILENSLVFIKHCNILKVYIAN